MKKVFAVLLTALLLVSCSSEKQPLNFTENPLTDEVPTSPVIRADETLPLHASSSAYYADGTIYFAEGGWLKYMPVETGEARVFCFDPLCIHDELRLDSDCPAIVYDSSTRVIVENGVCYFIARHSVQTGAASSEDTWQLRAIDIESSRLRVLYETDIQFFDFWLLGDTIFLTEPAVVELDEDGKMTYLSGKNIVRLEKNGKTTVMLEDADELYPELIGSDGGALYYTSKYTGGTVYRTDYGFERSETAATVERGACSFEIHDGWIYYIRRTGEYFEESGEEIAGEFDEQLSVLSAPAERCELVRQRLNGEGEIETVCASVPMPKLNAQLSNRLFCIDRERNWLYYVPLELSYRGCVVWEIPPEEAAFYLRFGEMHDRPVLTKKFSLTGGRLVELDLDTMQARDVLTDCGADIVDLYGVEDGRVWAQFEPYDVEKIEDLRAAGVKSDTRLTYSMIGSEEILP